MGNLGTNKKLLKKYNDLEGSEKIWEANKKIHDKKTKAVSLKKDYNFSGENYIKALGLQTSNTQDESFERIKSTSGDNKKRIKAVKDEMSKIKQNNTPKQDLPAYEQGLYLASGIEKAYKAPNGKYLSYEEALTARYSETVNLLVEIEKEEKSIDKEAKKLGFVRKSSQEVVELEGSSTAPPSSSNNSKDKEKEQFEYVSLDYEADVEEKNDNTQQEQNDDSKTPTGFDLKHYPKGFDPIANSKKVKIDLNKIKQINQNSAALKKMKDSLEKIKGELDDSIRNEYEINLSVATRVKDKRKSVTKNKNIDELASSGIKNHNFAKVKNEITKEHKKELKEAEARNKALDRGLKGKMTEDMKEYSKNSKKTFTDLKHNFGRRFKKAFKVGFLGKYEGVTKKMTKPTKHEPNLKDTSGVKRKVNYVPNAFKTVGNKIQDKWSDVQNAAKVLIGKNERLRLAAKKKNQENTKKLTDEYKAKNPIIKTTFRDKINKAKESVKEFTENTKTSFTEKFKKSKNPNPETTPQPINSSGSKSKTAPVKIVKQNTQEVNLEKKDKKKRNKNIGEYVTALNTEDKETQRTSSKTLKKSKKPVGKYTKTLNEEIEKIQVKII